MDSVIVTLLQLPGSEYSKDANGFIRTNAFLFHEKSIWVLQESARIQEEMCIIRLCLNIQHVTATKRSASFVKNLEENVHKIKITGIVNFHL